MTEITHGNFPHKAAYPFGCVFVREMTDRKSTKDYNAASELKNFLPKCLVISSHLVRAYNRFSEITPLKTMKNLPDMVLF